MSSAQDRYMDRRFYQRVALAVITNAVLEAKGGGRAAREWLVSENVDLWAEGAGLDPDYVRRIVPNAWCKVEGKKIRHVTAQTKEKSKRGPKKGKLTTKQRRFIKAYRRCGDELTARYKAEVSTSTMRKWLKKPHIIELMHNKVAIEA